MYIVSEINKNSAPNPNEQHQLDLANAEAAVNEAAQPVLDDLAATRAPYLIREAQNIADAAGEGANIGDEAEDYLNNGGVARDLGEEALKFLYKETIQPLSAEEIAKEASDYLAPASNDDLASKITKIDPPSLTKNYSKKQIDQMLRNIKEARGSEDFRDMRKDHEPPNDQ